jgi:hypothetical protein
LSGTSTSRSRVVVHRLVLLLGPREHAIDQFGREGHSDVGVAIVGIDRFGERADIQVARPAKHVVHGSQFAGALLAVVRFMPLDGGECGGEVGLLGGPFVELCGQRREGGRAQKRFLIVRKLRRVHPVQDVAGQLPLIGRRTGR